MQPLSFSRLAKAVGITKAIQKTPPPARKPYATISMATVADVVGAITTVAVGAAFNSSKLGLKLKDKKLF